MALSNSKKSANILWVIFIILTFSVCIGGFGLYLHQKKNIKTEKHAELAAISKLKVDQIVNWRKDRLENARNIYNNQAIITHISEYIHGLDNYSNYLTITRWIKTLLEEPDYSMVALIDTSGKVFINVNSTKPIAENSKRIIEKAIQSKDIVFSDLHKYNEKNIHIDLAIPLYLNPEEHKGLTAVVFIRIDPEKYLYPMVLSWPTPSRTSEILLVRREGDSVLYLSDLQHKKHTAYRLRKSMTDTHILAVQAVAGITDVKEGIDYRGIKVLGDTRAVPDSPWFVVTKVDIDEIYHPISVLAIWIFIITFLLILSSGLIIYVVWTRQLIKSEQERDLALEMLRASEKELEQRVDERTIQLQTANKELEAFSYSVSHDLRAPLCNIEGWSMVLLEHCSDQLGVKGLEYLDHVRNETHRMKNLIDALLKLSRVSRTELTKVNVDLTSLAQNITNRLRKDSKDRRIEIIIQPGMFTFGDPNMLESALTNLLDNAYKFTGKQSLSHIEFGHSVIKEKQTFWVRDNGAGFDMANSKNLFGAFQRMHAQSDFPGTGIGLATVQRIIHRHDGLIWAESKINQGTTFYFTIPEAITLS